MTIAIGFLKAHEYINGGLTPQQSAQLADFLTSLNRTIWNSSLTLVEKDLLVFNLVAVGNIGKVNLNIFPPSVTLENTKSVAQRIKNISIDKDWQHLIAIHRLLHGNQYHNNNVIAIGNDYYECMLDAATTGYFDASINPLINNFNCTNPGVNFECEYYNNLYRNDLDDDTLIEYDTLYVDLDTNNNPKYQAIYELNYDFNEYNYMFIPTPIMANLRLLKHIIIFVP